jgi:tripartite-type tricarboxylate transporter receptor subunit TctC
MLANHITDMSQLTLALTNNSRKLLCKIGQTGFKSWLVRKCNLGWRWKMNHVRSSLLHLFALIALLGASTIVVAQSTAWPTRPVRIVVGFPPGGSADGIARALGQSMSKTLGQPIVIDNRPGALATIGSEHVARSAPDGNTVLLGFAGGHSLTPAIMTMRFDPIKELPPLAAVSRGEQVFVTNASKNLNSLADYVAWAKANSGKGNFGSIGNGSANHLVSVLFERAAGIQSVFAPYQGAAPAIQGLLTGEIDILEVDLAAAMPMITSGKLSALAVTSSKRSSFLPKIPTTAEAGFPGIVSESVVALFMPVGVPTEVTKTLQRAVSLALADADVQKTFQTIGVIPFDAAPAEVQALIRKQSDELVPLVKELNIRLNL